MRDFQGCAAAGSPQLARFENQQCSQRFDVKGKVGFFETTGKYSQILEQGHGGCAIAKHKKRVGTAFAIDGEILVVASTFRDQRQRTIEFLQSEIETSAEKNTIAMVLHQDLEGSARLKTGARPRYFNTASRRDGLHDAESPMASRMNDSSRGTGSPIQQ